jgi:hypothetical protein
VTLGTLALYRGLAHVVLGTSYVSNFPAAFTTSAGYVPGTSIPWTLLAFLILAVVACAIVHLTWIGRQVFADRQEQGRGALFRRSGRDAQDGPVRGLGHGGGVRRHRPGVPDHHSVRSDNGTGLTLTVVMIAVLGGVDINGGKGTIPGVILAVFTLAALKSALRLAGCLERLPERGHRAASDRLGHRPPTCSPVPGVGRSRSPRSTDRLAPNAWRGRSVALEGRRGSKFQVRQGGVRSMLPTL